VRVDDHRDRLARDGPDLVEDSLSVVGELRIDKDDAVGGLVDGRRATLAGYPVEAVGDLLDLAKGRLLRGDDAEGPGDDDESQDELPPSADGGSHKGTCVYVRARHHPS
jgi:hypothetical protein